MIEPHTNRGFNGPARGRVQSVLNQRWPQRDENGGHARDIPLGMGRHDVHVRIHWEHDGWEVLEGRVTRWVVDVAAYVELDDPRLIIGGVWVATSDVQPRMP